MHRTIIVGSPRENGRSAHLADELFQACIDECPKDGVSIVSVSSISVDGCKGCDACKALGEETLPEEGDPLYPKGIVCRSDALKHKCIIEDDMAEVRKHLDAADELIVVSPVYFSSVPSQLKALLDRMQPYYWSDLRKQKPKRTLVLHIVGEGGDPHGVKPLISAVRSSCAVAGFKLSRVLDWRGCIEPDGQIIADARECD